MQLVYTLSIILPNGLLHFGLFPLLFSCPLNFETNNHIQTISLKLAHSTRTLSVTRSWFRSFSILLPWLSNWLLQLWGHPEKGRKLFLQIHTSQIVSLSMLLHQGKGVGFWFSWFNKNIVLAFAKVKLLGCFNKLVWGVNCFFKRHWNVSITKSMASYLQN